LNAHVPNSGWPALVLNADFRPLSYYPLSLWSWQDAIKAVFLERVNIVAQYDKRVHSPSLEMKLPSVVSLKTYVKPSTHRRSRASTCSCATSSPASSAARATTSPSTTCCRARAAGTPCGTTWSRPARPAICARAT
jgi:5-methylcytosine-specific restriction endonuclease McrA